MMTFAKIVYWFLSIVAAALLVMAATSLVDVGVPDWWLHALSTALLAVCVWFVGWVFRYVVRAFVPVKG